MMLGGQFMSYIKIEHVSKDYGHSKGIFDISFTVNKGEVFGYLGPNGAGKTTTIRNLLGFIHPDQGHIYVNDNDTWLNHHLTNKIIGYLPGEINFPSSMNGEEVLKWNRELKKVNDVSFQNELIEYFELKHLETKVKRMSKGMKQKLGLICAFMNNPDILVLDEPTSGLDPLMQDKFVRLIKRFKDEGKTILMSSHMFSEIEKTCDRVAIIKSGHIVSIFTLREIFDSEEETFLVEFVNEKDAIKYAKSKKIDNDKNYVKITIKRAEVDYLLKELSVYKIHKMSEIKKTLEDVFMNFYEANKEENIHD